MGLVLPGCASYLLNEPIAKYDDKTGYRFPEAIDADLNTGGNTDSLFVCLLFSGGGTRAAAFAYGVLSKLKQTSIVWNGKSKSLLDEVDCISGISGGSFTAAYYGLFGERIFTDFRARFLDRDIQGELFGRALSPFNWPRLASPTFNRIDLATELYDESIFDHKTFADMKRQEHKPFIILNATDLATGERFEFTQAQFDLLGSDLEKLPVARAVAASSAFPVLLSPITIKNYPQPDNYLVPQDIRQGLESYQFNRRFWHWAYRANEYLNKVERPFIHLMDGGLSDNIGLKAIEHAYRRSGGFIRQRMGGKIEKLVFIVANARTDNQDTISKRDVPPDLSEVGYKTATISLDNYSFETIVGMRDLVEQRKQIQATLTQCNDKLKTCAGVKPFPTLRKDIEPVFIDLSFETYPNETIRKELLAMPTSFALPKKSVDHLINAAGILLDENQDFKILRQELQKDPVQK
jgi:predicted acylesterase/phospholipase RssA